MKETDKDLPESGFDGSVTVVGDVVGVVGVVGDVGRRQNSFFRFRPEIRNPRLDRNR